MFSFNWVGWGDIIGNIIMLCNSNLLPTATHTLATFQYYPSYDFKAARKEFPWRFHASVTPSFRSGQSSVSLTRIAFTAQSNKINRGMQQWPHCTTQEQDGFIQATAHSRNIFPVPRRNGRRMPIVSKRARILPVSYFVLIDVIRLLCLDKRTSKSTSGRQLHPQNGPWIFSTGSLSSFSTMNFGEKGCHC